MAAEARMPQQHPDIDGLREAAEDLHRHRAQMASELSAAITALELQASNLRDHLCRLLSPHEAPMPAGPGASNQFTGDIYGAGLERGAVGHGGSRQG